MYVRKIFFQRLLPNSNSTKPESSSSGKARPRVLASDSAAAESDFCTPKNRPNALRYISSSSRGMISFLYLARLFTVIIFDCYRILLNLFMIIYIPYFFTSLLTSVDQFPGGYSGTRSARSSSTAVEPSVILGQF